MVHRDLRGAAAMFVAVVIAASCGDNGKASSTTTRPPTTTAAPTTTAPPSTTAAPNTTMAVPSSVSTADVTVIKDLSYGDQIPGAWEPLLNVYAPSGASGLPLVVLFHGGEVNKDYEEFPPLAQAIAARGAVVVTPNWGPRTGKAAANIDAAVAEADAYVGGAACAVSFAVTHAAEWGAAADTVTLAGHSGGTIPASVLAFAPRRGFSGCAVPAATWTPKAAVLWDGDPVFNPNVWDSLGPDLSKLFATLTPWTTLKSGFAGPVRFVVADWSRTNLRRCDDVGVWAPKRDPSGEYESLLRSIGAVDDGCVDMGEMWLAFGAAMTAGGVDNSFVPLSDHMTTHQFLSDDDRQRVAQITYDLAVG